MISHSRLPPLSLSHISIHISPKLTAKDQNHEPKHISPLHSIHEPKPTTDQTLDAHDQQSYHHRLRRQYQTTTTETIMSSSSPTTTTNLTTHHQTTITTNTNNLPPPPPHPPATTHFSSTSTLPREYRKGNWTLHETLVLITAKRLDDERRSLPTTSPRPNTTANCSILSPVPSSSSLQCGGSGVRSAELRWKWVENYCWGNGCLRSQNQCNDKWDNLLRDYKKVRDYEARTIPVSEEDTKNTGDSNRDVGRMSASYWAMEKHERKERNLPSNLVFDVFQALTDVISRRNAARGGGGHHNVGFIDVRGSSNSANACIQLPVSLRQHSVPVSNNTPAVLTPAVRPSPPEVVNHIQSPAQTLVVPQPLKIRPPESYSPEEISESSERSTESGRRKRRKKVRDLGSSVVKGASLLSRTLMACEEKREKRHIEMTDLEERRLKMENERTELTRQGMVGLIAAVNNLSGAIHALVTDHHHHLRHCSDDNNGDDDNR